MKMLQLSALKQEGMVISECSQGYNLRRRCGNQDGGTIVIVDDSTKNLSSVNRSNRWSLMGNRDLLVYTLMGARRVVVI
jgi:hypothetical protein